MKNILSLFRVRHYVKNLFIFLPIFFGLEITNLSLLGNTVIAFVSFCLVASAVYIMNDLKDLENDRLHERKKDRPLVTGKITIPMARTLLAISLTTGLTTAFLLNWNTGLIMALYFVINIAYSFALKHIPIVDVSIIGIGFVLRLLVGSAVANIPLSMWIILMVFLLSLFLGFAERREDILIFMKNGEKMRPVVDGYNLEFLNAAMLMMASVIVVSYILYTVSVPIENDYLYLTTFFVLLGILRYMQLSFVHNHTGSPVDILLRDRFIQITILAWGILFWLILYV